MDLFETSFRSNWELPALTDYFKDETFTYGQVAQQIARLHILFSEMGLERGDRVSIVGRNNPRWCIAFLATISYGAVVVPILQDFNQNDIQHIIHHSESVLLFVGDQHWDSVDEGEVSTVRGAFSLTDFGCLYLRDPGVELATDRLFGERYASGFTVEDMSLYRCDPGDVVVLNYTSGTTGFSKGVMLTANNFVGNLVFGRSIHKHFQGSRALAFLPLAHAYGCTFDFLYPLIMGAHVTLLGKIPTPKVLLEAMERVRPNIIFCVPLIIEKIYRKQIVPFLDNGVTRFALRVPVLDTALYAVIRKKLVDAFGGEFDQIIIGGAPLNAQVEEFLRKIKFPFTVGYGMTECAPLVSFETWEQMKPFSCGRVLPGLMEARVESSDPQNVAGEVWVRGENVMKGYYKNEQATAEVLDGDGWLHTGDMGTMDEDGTLYLRGRSKSMILTSTGQNIYPEEIEARLNNMSCVMESLVVERGGRLVALVYPDYDQLDEGGCKDRGCVEGIMRSNLDVLNSQLAAYERVAEIVLYPSEFEKTPKRSIKRYLYEV